MSDWVQDPGPTYELVRIEGDDLACLNRLCNGSDKTKNEVISSALYVLEQSLLAKEAVPVIPPLRIKLEPTGIVGKDWLHSVMTIGMRPGGDIVQGLADDEKEKDE